RTRRRRDRGAAGRGQLVDGSRRGAAPIRPRSVRQGGRAMTLWWIGNAVLALVVAPAVIVLLVRLLKQVNRLNRLADKVLDQGVAVTTNLDALPKLLETQQLATAAHGLVGRYGAALLGVVAKQN